MFKQGDTVICKYQGDGVTFGKTYEVVTSSQFENHVLLTADDGFICAFPKSWFNLEKSKAKEQIIHGNNQVEWGCSKGITWILSKVEDSRYVGVQYSLCSSKDNYCRKTGVAVARQKPMQMVLKTKVYQFMHNVSDPKNTPHVDYGQLYQAVVRLD